MKSIKNFLGLIPNVKSEEFLSILKMRNVLRWKEFKPLNKDNEASHSAKTGLYGVLALLKEKQLGNEINGVSLLGKIIFGNLGTTLSGGIKHSTKHNPIVSESLKSKRREDEKLILSYFHPLLQETMKSFIVHAEDETIEGRLADQLSDFNKLMFCHREVVETQSLKFSKKEQEIYKKIRENSPFPSVQWLVEEYQKQEDVYQFLMWIQDLETIERWSDMENLITDDDAKHTYQCAAMAFYFSLLKKEVFQEDIDVFTVVAKTLAHDLPEVPGGDINSTTKHCNPKMSEQMERMEIELAEYMISKLPSFMRSDMQEFMVHAKSKNEEGKMVDIVDKLDAILKARKEVQVNEENYLKTYEKIIEKFKMKYGQENVIIYFFNNIYTLKKRKRKHQPSEQKKMLLSKKSQPSS